MNSFFPISLSLQQLLNQLLFLFVGKVVYRLSVTWVEIAGIVLASIVIEHVMLLAVKRKVPSFSMPSISTAFNIAFMLGGTWFGVYILALVAGLGAKNLSKKLTGRHFQNPSNLGIAVALLAFPRYTYVTFLDWGQTWWFAGVIVGLGSLLLWRIGILYVPFVFLASYALLSGIFLTQNGGEIVRMLLPAGFLLFSFFMITEPRALPASPRFRSLHAVLTALFLVTLQLLLGPKEVNLFLALVLAGCFVPLWRRWESLASNRLPSRTVAAAAAILVYIAVLYVSPWNLRANGLASYQALLSRAPAREITVNMRAPRAVGAQELKPAVWNEGDYGRLPTAPVSGHVVAYPLVKQAMVPESRFALGQGVLPPYDIPLPGRDVGFQYMPYAGVAVGDLNLDGALDVVLARPFHPLMVLLNDGHGRFSDATAAVFESEVPQDVEHVTLGDLDGDGRLDLLLVFSRYRTQKPATIYRFVPGAHRFAEYARLPSAGHTSGGVTLYDVNRDGILDIYISYGRDWLDPAVGFEQRGDQDTLLLSEQGKWVDRTGDIFGPVLGKETFVGMTALFTDVNGDGAADFLLGNDFSHPTLTFFQRNGRFDLARPGTIENNTQFSMSYFPLDADNDGVYELWENGSSSNLTRGRVGLSKVFTGLSRTPLERDFDELEKENSLRKFNCEAKRTPIGISLCHDLTLALASHQSSDDSHCHEANSDELRVRCLRGAHAQHLRSAPPTPREFTYNVEKYPKQLQENVLLQVDGATGQWKNVLKGVNAAEFTGLSWAAATDDFDNDGLTDLYVGTGGMEYSHDTNRLLLNRSQANSIRFEEHAPGWQVAFEAESRGIGAADFDGDGDVDMLVNNYLSEPMYLENLAAGSAIVIDLRQPASHNMGNAYAIGATVLLRGKTFVQKKNVMNGGIWNTSQATTLHFGVGADSGPFSVTVTWPDGAAKTEAPVSPGNRYVIYR